MLRFCERHRSASAADSTIHNRSSDKSNLKSEISNLKSEIARLVALAESCSRQLRGWADSLQNSDIRGQRNLSARSREAYESNRRAKAFLKQVDEVMRRRTSKPDSA
jgi:predicted RNase H-like nuclease (RuvC/YqgF family)